MAPSEENWERKAKALVDKNVLLKKQVQELTQRCKMQEKILSFGGYSTLQLLLDHFVTYAKAQLKPIMQEARLADFDPETAVAIYQFRAYLLSIHTQLGELELQSKISSASMRRAQNKYIEIGKRLESLQNLSDEKLDALVAEEERLHEYILQLLEEENPS